MPCKKIIVGDTVMFVRFSGKRKRCAFCDAEATKQCDYPRSPNPQQITHAKKICDKYLCDKCAVNVAPGEDWCPDHPLRTVRRIG